MSLGPRQRQRQTDRDRESVLSWNADLFIYVAAYSTELQALLDTHGPATTRKIRPNRSAPGFTTQVANAKTQCPRAERAWCKSGLAVHREIYQPEKHLVTLPFSQPNPISTLPEFWTVHHARCCFRSGM